MWHTRAVERCDAADEARLEWSLAADRSVLRTVRCERLKKRLA